MKSKFKQQSQNFKNQIKREFLEKKKNQIRKALAFYDDSFKDFDQQSSATNSRSSGFPVRCKNDFQAVCNNLTKSKSTDGMCNNQFSNLQVQKQQRFIDQLRNFGACNLEEKRIAIETAITKHLGESCFESYNKLQENVMLKLQQTEYQLDILVPFKETQIDWKFIIAAYYLATAQGLQQLRSKSFSLLAKHFNGWLRWIMTEKINNNSSFQQFSAQMLEISKLDIKVQQICLSTLLTSIQHHQLPESLLQQILAYIEDRILMFRVIQRQIVQIYGVQALQQISFTEVLYNFGFSFVIETLYSQIFDQPFDFPMSQKTHLIFTKYFTLYPVVIVNDTIDPHKLERFIAEHLYKSLSYLQFYEKQIDSGILKDNSQFLQAHLTFIRSVLQRKLPRLFYQQTIQIWEQTTQIILKTDVIENILEYEHIHFKIIDMYIKIFFEVQLQSNWLDISKFFIYFRFYFMNYTQLKQNIRSSIRQHGQNDQTGQIIRKCFNLQLLSVIALAITKICTQQINNNLNKQCVELLFTHCQLMYKEDSECLKSFPQEKAETMLLFGICIQQYQEIVVELQDRSEVSNPQQKIHSNQQMSI